jgi:hypothetical protein
VAGEQPGGRPTDALNGGPVDLVVVAVIVALAALGFLWLGFVENA